MTVTVEFWYVTDSTLVSNPGMEHIELSSFTCGRFIYLSFSQDLSSFTLLSAVQVMTLMFF